MPTSPPKKSGLAVLIGIGGKPKGESDSQSTDAERGAAEKKDSGYEDTTGQYIKPPDGFKAPDDKRPGESFTGTFRAHLDDDGNLCFDAINDIPMHKESEETPEQEATESPEEQENEEEMGTEEHEAPEEVESPSEEDDEMTSRKKFNKVFGRK